MKKKINKKVLAASICIACMSSVTSVQADSLLAPLVISDIANGFETTLSFKVRGTGAADHSWARFGANEANISKLHYIWLQKGSTIGAMFNRTKECNHVDNNGLVSPWDMVSQTVNPTLQILAQVAGTDATVSGINAGGNPGGRIANPAAPFYGMAILDDVASLKSKGNVEGNSSGFAYVINYFTGMMLDYKLVNNHKTAESGNFSAGFARKTSVDLSWNPLNRDLTLWLAVATGPGMTSGNGWAGAINISQQLNNSLGLGKQVTPKVPHGGSTGVYNNDEVNLSGDTPLDITCMGMFTRANFMNPTQLAGTVNGGWTRKSIVGSNGSTGGMIYKAELKLIPSIISGTAVTAFQSETSGHLATSGTGPHPNRPY